MQTIGRWGLRVPEGSDGPPNVPLRMLQLATDLSDVAKDNQGTLAARPTSTTLTPGITGRYYYVTGDPDAAQNGRHWRDTGTGWVEIPAGPGQRWEVGDYKVSAQAADHGDMGSGVWAWLLCEGRETPAAYTRLITFLTGLGTGVGVNGRPNLPDPRGRVPVFRGTHAEVDTIGDSDGLAVGSRKVKHRHGKGTISASGGSHSHTGTFAFGPTAYSLAGPGGVVYGVQATTNSVAASTHSHPNSEFSGEVGDTAGPLDGPAFQVIGNLFIRAA